MNVRILLIKFSMHFKTEYSEGDAWFLYMNQVSKRVIFRCESDHPPMQKDCPFPHAWDHLTYNPSTTGQIVSLSEQATDYWVDIINEFPYPL